MVSSINLIDNRKDTKCTNDTWWTINSLSCIQSFQVEGPKNREISLFIENTIGRFFTETFHGRKIARNSCYHVITCSINRTSAAQTVTILWDTSAYIKKDEKPDFSATLLLLQRGFVQVRWFFNKSGDFHSKSGDREMFIIISKIGRSPAKSGDLEALCICKQEICYIANEIKWCWCWCWCCPVL